MSRIQCCAQSHVSFARSGLAVRASTIAQMRALSAQNGPKGSGLPAKFGASAEEHLGRSSFRTVFVRRV
jgi:hypothetical protein